MAEKQRIPLILEISGHGLDFVNLIVALRSPQVDLLGVTVTSSLCFPVDGPEVVFKILSFLGREEVPVALSEARAANPVDAIVRAKAMGVAALPQLIAQDISKFRVDPAEAAEFLVRKVKESKSPVTILCAAPLSNLAKALEAPGFLEGLHRVVIQGGSLADSGDVVCFHHNGKAESRFFWDPISAKKVIASGAPLTLAPLELATGFSEFDDLLTRFDGSGAAEIEALIGQIFAHRIGPSRSKLGGDFSKICGIYSILRPEFFTQKTEKLVVTVDAPEQGVLHRNEQGGKVEVLALNENTAKGIAEVFFEAIKVPVKLNFLGEELPQPKLPPQESARRMPVFIDHDGAVDDIFGLMMIFAMPHVELLGVGVTGADCFVDDGARVTLKLLKMFGRDSVRVSKSGALLRNNFPCEWRVAGAVMDRCPQMASHPYEADRLLSIPTHEFMIEVLEQAEEPITFFVSGPMNNLARALTIRPDLAANIKEVVAMGGAIFVNGNVDQFDHDGSAEWNIFTDAQALQTVIDSKVRVILFSLDATNHVPLSFDFLKSLASQAKFSASRLLGFFMSLTVIAIPSDCYAYFLWDPLAAAFLGDVKFCELKEVNIVVDTLPPSEGRTRPVTEGGSPVFMAHNVNVPLLYDYILDLLKFHLK